MMMCFLALPLQKLKSTFCGLHTTALFLQWPVVLGFDFIPFTFYLFILYSFDYYHYLASELMLVGKIRQFGCKLTEFRSDF